jgi:CRISPR-associated protein Cmr1
MKMKILEYNMTFHSPAFLGNAEQSGQWRTPPIKALLRQWWRVAYAADKGFRVDVGAMREAEGVLFGNAWLKDNFSKSRVRLRLEHWDEGTLTQWPQPEATVHHPEVKGGINVGSALYLGYGPLRYQKGGTALKAKAAIQCGTSATLSLAIPEEDAPLIEQALWLMDRYGTLGGRSRNGWGSFSLTPLSPEVGWAGDVLPLRAWQECLQMDWPHAIGKNEQNQPLIWQTGSYDNWKSVLQCLAGVKIGTRRLFLFPTAAAGGIHDRHWLSYPVTNHMVKAWGNMVRLPNTLRFKVRPAADGKWVGVIFHVPHLPPQGFQPDRKAIIAVWQQVHTYLSAPQQNLTRIPL